VGKCTRWVVQRQSEEPNPGTGTDAPGCSSAACAQMHSRRSSPSDRQILGHRLGVGQDIDVPMGLLIMLEVASQAAFQSFQRTPQIKVISFGELPGGTLSGSQLSHNQPAPGRQPDKESIGSRYRPAIHAKLHLPTRLVCSSF